MRTLALSVAMMALGGTAVAGGLAPPAEPVITPPPAFNWTGAYAGAQIGYIDSDIDLDGQNLNNNNTMSSSDLNANGLIGGIFAGYNWHPAGNLVYGIEGEFNFTDADKTGDGVPPPSFGFQRGGIESEIDTTAAVRARIGYAHDRTLFYAAGGVAFAEIDLQGFNNAGASSPFSYSDTRVGWTIGGGVEHAITDQWVARLDYRFSDFGDDNFSFTSTAGTPHSFEVESQTHEVKVGVAYRF